MRIRSFLVALLLTTSAAVAQQAQPVVPVLPNFTDSTTFTPGIAFGGGTTGITYSTQQGRYVRIGKQICFQLYISLSNKGSSTGSATITGLPVANNGNVHTVALANTSGLTFTGTFEGYINGGTAVVLRQNSAGMVSDLTNTSFSNSTDIAAGGCYFTS
jgi:hypothetical protein